LFIDFPYELLAERKKAYKFKERASACHVAGEEHLQYILVIQFMMVRCKVNSILSYLYKMGKKRSYELI